VTHPKSNVKALFGLQQMASSPYQPSLRSAPDGWELALLFAPASANFNLPVWVALDGAGNVWIVNGGPGGNSVTELPAGDYNNAINIAPPGAQFFVPFAIATDTAGNVFVANAANNSVSELPAGNFNAGATNLAPTDANFSQPAALALDKSANLWVANLSGGTGCSKSPPAVPCGGISELRAANYSADGVHFAPIAAKFDGLLTIAFDAIGNLWTSNEFGNSVTEFTAAKPRQFINYAPASAGFVRPIALALDAANNVWVVNSSGGSGCGTKVPCGSVTELPASNPSGAVNFNPPSAEILGPNSIAVDSKGNLWVSNAGPSGCESATCGSVSELAAVHPNAGAMNFAPRGAAFQHPTLLALDESGNVWVSQFRGVTEIVGLAGPVLTPIQACLKTGSSVCRP